MAIDWRQSHLIDRSTERLERLLAELGVVECVGKRLDMLVIRMGQRWVEKRLIVGHYIQIGREPRLLGIQLL